MTTLSAFKSFTNDLKEQEQLMPVFFIGHGSPMNGIEDNEFSNRWNNGKRNSNTGSRAGGFGALV